MRRLFILSTITTACIIFMASSVFSKNDVRIAIFPFAVQSDENLDYFSKEIPAFLKKYLILEGADLVQSMDQDVVDWQFDENEIKTIRKQAESMKVDYVIWGRFTQKGQGFVLRVALADTLYRAPVRYFDAKGEDLVNLNSTVKDLAKQISNAIMDIPLINKISIKGNERIEAAAIKRAMKTRKGDPYVPARLSEDLQIIFQMGFFDDIRIESETTEDGGRNVTFHVKEKPTIYKIHIKGNSVFDEEKIRENIDISMGSILNIFRVQENIKRIETMYKEKNYHNVKVEYTLKDKDNNQTEISFKITENKKVLIHHIHFIGNKAYTKKQLLKMIATQEKGFFSWITSSGDLDSEKLNQDGLRLRAYYHNNGYMDARVGEPQVVIKETHIEVTIKIVEGQKYTLGNVDLSGDLILPKDKLITLLKLKSNEIYNRDIVREDLEFLTDLYGNAGYAFADIYPKVKKEDENLKVNIIYHIDKGEQIHFDRIIITGNTKTRDKVIRRELRVYEQELYSGVGIKQCTRNLNRLDFFEDVKITTQKGVKPNTMDLKVEVKEKPTGMFSFGGGYSSVENAFIVGSISQRNLFGRGQILEAKGQIGGSTNQFNISFTEPWLFDMPLSFGVDAFNWTREYDEYDKDSKGGRIRLGYPIFRHTRGYISYGFDRAEIYNIEFDAPSTIAALEGVNETSSAVTTIHYDTRDRIFNPSDGMDHSFSFEYAGGFLGGDIGFNKYILKLGKYTPLFWNTVGFIHAEAGYVKEHSGEVVPDYERFHLGGINSLRGFDWEDLSPEETIILSVNNDGSFNTIKTKVGGNKYVQFNVEFIFPIIQSAGLMGLFFYDTGGVYDDGVRVKFDELRESAGYGFRWFSPIGPIRLEHGYILDPRENESSDGRWEFSMGSVF
ncbi:Outer membrane protein assembly factor yaeT [Candidatus Magnetomorum sp. HK-1]|nr:Outer membrane protein assembly factor yaeT [Candidatus Magnetomorum sp. HK-1]